jgi:hypothetical protein
MSENGQQITSRAEFAEMCGVSRAAVTKACNASLKAACIGNRIDAAHPAAVKYWQGKESDKTLPAKKPPQKPEMQSPAQRKPSGRAAQKAAKKAGHGDKPPVVPVDITEYWHLTLSEICLIYGTDTRFADWLRASRDIESIHEKRIKNARAKGELVHRNLVKIGIIDPINAAHIKILTAGAKTIAVRLEAMAKSGSTQEAMEAVAQDLLSSFIKPVKDKVRRMLQNI